MYAADGKRPVCRISSCERINLYNKIVKLENTIKSHLTQQDEDKINKEYNKFYNRNEEARKYKT